MPISLDRQDISERLYNVKKPQEFVVAQKADGERLFLGFLNIDGVKHTFLVNRKFEIMFYDDAWPVHEAAFEGSLFDVEWINLPSFGPTLMVFDTMAVHGNTCSSVFYPHRVGIAKAFLEAWSKETGIDGTIEPPPPRHSYIHQTRNRIVRVTSDVCATVKDVYHLGEIKDIEKPLFITDGYIFTLTTAPYVPFRTPSIMKWKPKELITCDFIIAPAPLDGNTTIERYELPGQFATAAKTPTPHGIFACNAKGKLLFVGYIDIEDSDDAADMYGKIHECGWSDSGWHIHRARTDKSHPNSITTILKTLRQMEESVDITELY